MPRPASALLLAFAVLLVTACGRPSWQEVSIGDGGFRVLMRPEPHYERKELDTAVGRITAHLYTMELDDSVFAVGYSDYPSQLIQTAAPRRLFMSVRDTWVRRINGTLQGPGRDIRLEAQYPGMEMIASGTLGSRDAYLHARFYLVGNRLYQIVVFGNRDTIPLGEINRFFGSFKLIPQKEAGSIEIAPTPDKKR